MVAVVRRGRTAARRTTGAKTQAERDAAELQRREEAEAAKAAAAEAAAEAARWRGKWTPGKLETYEVNERGIAVPKPDKQELSASEKAAREDASKQLPETIRKLDHNAKIKERRRWRFLPGYLGVALLGYGLIANVLVSVYAWAGGKESAVVGALSLVPLLVALVAAWHVARRRQEDDPRWTRTLLCAGVAGALLVYWISQSGVSGPVLATVFATTYVCGRRVWKQRPIGPNVPPLVEEPEPAGEEPGLEATDAGDESDVDSESTDKATTIVLEDCDQYPILWWNNNASGQGAAIGSKLTGCQVGDGIRTYRIEMVPGAMTFDQLWRAHALLATGLLLPLNRVLLHRARQGEPSNIAHLTIIEREMVSNTRLFTTPEGKVQDGKITGLARFVDGHGELTIHIYNDRGMIPLAIVGDMGGGKSAAGNVVLTCAMNTGLFNLLYIDWKGNSSTALQKHARIVILNEAAKRAPELVWAIMKARSEYSQQEGMDLLLPSKKFPGLILFHDEISAVLDDTKVAARWCNIANTVRSLGLWFVAMSQAMQAGKWGDDQLRKALFQQAVFFYMKTFSDKLVPGLTYAPHNLPVDEADRPVPGIAVQIGVWRPNTPALWDWLPSDVDKVPAGLITPEMVRASEAFATFFKTPELHEVDRKAIESVLGPPDKDGRWIVGGTGKHKFPDGTGTMGGFATGGSPDGGLEELPTAARRGEQRQRARQMELMQAIAEGACTWEEIANSQYVSIGRSQIFEVARALCDRDVLQRVEGGGWEPGERWQEELDELLYAGSS